MLRSESAMLRETAKNTRAASYTPQAAVSIFNVKVHDNIIRKKNKHMWLVWKGFQERASCLYKEYDSTA